MRGSNLEEIERPLPAISVAVPVTVLADPTTPELPLTQPIVLTLPGGALNQAVVCVSLCRFLVVIEHHHANIYAAINAGTVPVIVQPDETGGKTRHLYNEQDIASGKRRPEIKKFYDDVIGQLEGADSVLIFGSSTDRASAMVHLITELKSNHPTIAGKIVGHQVLDRQHLTEDQVLAAAREFYASHRPDMVSQSVPVPAPPFPPVPYPVPPTDPPAPQPFPPEPIVC